MDIDEGSFFGKKTSHPKTYFLVLKVGILSVVKDFVT